MLIAYCVGNAASPFMWQAKYTPRLVLHVHCRVPSQSTDHVRSNHVPWTIIGICYLACMFLLLAIRWLLARENKKRDAEPQDDTYDEVYIEVITPEGKREERKVSKVKQFYDQVSRSILCRNSCLTGI
jgi:MFS transporter, ACS family, allantoate permease